MTARTTGGAATSPARGAAPVRLDVANRLVYSIHDYPASVHAQPWFSAPDYPANLPALWDATWGYLFRAGTAPVLVGEFGTKLETTSDKQWLSALASYLGTGADGIHWTYWSWNPNSADTGGILNDDWQTINQAKQDMLVPLQFRLGGVTSLPPPAKISVVEYYNASLDHYFVTPLSTEQANLDAGLTPTKWTRTGRTFNAYDASGTGTSPVCRFYIPARARRLALPRAWHGGVRGHGREESKLRTRSFGVHPHGAADSGDVSGRHDAGLPRIQQPRGRQPPLHDRSRSTRADGGQGLGGRGRWSGPRGHVCAGVAEQSRAGRGYRQNACSSCC